MDVLLVQQPSMNYSSSQVQSASQEPDHMSWGTTGFPASHWVQPGASHAWDGYGSAVGRKSPSRKTACELGMDGERGKGFTVLKYSVWVPFCSVIQPSRPMWDLMSSCGWCMRLDDKREVVVMGHNQRTCLRLGPHLEEPCYKARSPAANLTPPSLPIVGTSLQDILFWGKKSTRRSAEWKSLMVWWTVGMWHFARAGAQALGQSKYWWITIRMWVWKHPD